MKRRSSTAAAVLANAAALLFCAGGCAGTVHSRAPARSSQPAPATGPAFGLTEDNADLLWSPSAARRTGGEPFQAARVELAALHPAYLRLIVDWAALQPRPNSPPALSLDVSGCARGVGPCGRYAGIRDELAAIASQQRAAGGAGFQVVVVILGAPSWAALAASGCEPAGTAAFSRPLRPTALADYRGLISSLLTLAAAEGVPLRWWSPWNEPNDPRFISPQQASCAAAGQPVSAGVYAQLARAMAAALRAGGGVHDMLLGELGDIQRDSPHATSVASFVAALPADVLCLAAAWSIHAYASRHAGAPADAVQALEGALDSRGGCTRTAPIWVTEAGAGAAHPGLPRPPGASDELAGCRALAGQLLGWYADPRVGAVFQYTFREDPAFPVGLASADLSHLYPVYRLWLAYTRLRAAGEPPPDPVGACT